MILHDGVIGKRHNQSSLDQKQIILFSVPNKAISRAPPRLANFKLDPSEAHERDDSFINSLTYLIQPSPTLLLHAH